MGKFIEGVESEFGYIIYTSSTNVELNIEERIKMTVDKDQFTQYRLLKVYSLYMLWSKDLNLGVTVISLNRLSEKNIKCETLLIAIA